MILYEEPRVAERVPIIDLGVSRGFGPEEQARAAAEIHEAARDIGFFYVTDHGVPRALIEAELAAAKAFFEQPIEEKLKIDIKQSSNMRGYEPMGLQTLDEGSPPDLKESLMLGRDLGPAHPWVQKGIGYQGANLWPPALPDFKQQVDAYMSAVIDLGRRLASLLAQSLDLPADYFADGLIETSCTTRMLRYPPQQKVADNQIGCGAHTDWGFITMLLQDDAGGLEVQNIAGEWLRAMPVPDAFVVNIGDMTARLTNGRYRSTPHRVLNNVSGRDRYSIAAFFDPDIERPIVCVPTCVRDGEETPPPVSYAEHLHEMFVKSYGKEAA